MYLEIYIKFIKNFLQIFPLFKAEECVFFFTAFFIPI